MVDAIVADRRLLYESERGQNPSSSRARKARTEAGATESVHYFFSPSSLSISAEVYFRLIYKTLKSTMYIE